MDAQADRRREVIELRGPVQVDAALLEALAADIVSDWVFECHRTDDGHGIGLRLARKDLQEPHTKRYEWQPHQLLFYESVLKHESSLLATDGDLPVGIALAEPTVWNNSLVVWEFHVRPDRRRQGIGTLMMDELEHKAARLGLAELMVETQADNGTAIDFYLSRGFTIQGIDTGLYGPGSAEVALFLRKRVAAG